MKNIIVYLILLSSTLVYCQTGATFIPNSKISKSELDSLFNSGMEEAKLDISKNIINYKFWGYPKECDIIFEKILKKEYNINVEPVGGDVVSSTEVSKWNGYNKIVKEYIFKKYGKDIIQEAYNDAKESLPGNIALNKDSVYSLLKYPELAKKNKIEGIVLVAIKLNKYGKVITTRIAKGLGYGCDKEALKLAKLLRFAPARNLKYAVKESPWGFVVPFKFKLK